uniref:Uncharacterized protein n=1 Tax=viral metagenome TaxID=1070528 RepID=A0A6M3IPD9_9ZZZZ
MKTVRVDKFKKGSNIFQSIGISRVKVTEIAEGDDGKRHEEIVCLEIPIQSTGISELINTFREKAPAPPVENVLLDPDSEEGKELGIVKKTWVKMPNLADLKYIRQKEEHGGDMGIAIVLKGLAVPLLDEEDKEITDREVKVKALKEMGISTDQFTQIASDITSLTRWTEKEKEDFFA